MDNQFSYDPYPYKRVKKPWGYELWICNNDQYCGKLLIFNNNEKSSWHFHKIKDEVIYIDKGEIFFIYSWFNDISKANSIKLAENMSFHVPPGLIHQIQPIGDTRIIEFSTHHEESDTFRLL